MATLLAATSQILMQNLQSSVEQMRQPQRAEKAAQHTGMAQNQAKTEKATEEPPSNGVDRIRAFEEKTLNNGNVMREYEDGTVRLHNEQSGVIQEERPDGSFLVSLPDGQVLYQQFHGHPLLAYDLNNVELPPRLAQVARVRLGQGEPSLAYTFDDASGRQLVELESLRLFRVKARVRANAAA
ncbi:MAG: hypothetical protein FJX76_04815 [Armatimonadetes bacterium]|nr:hypothetical protein [Armatimonadota bacterium]